MKTTDGDDVFQGWDPREIMEPMHKAGYWVLPRHAATGSSSGWVWMWHGQVEDGAHRVKADQDTWEAAWNRAIRDCMSGHRQAEGVLAARDRLLTLGLK